MANVPSLEEMMKAGVHFGHQKSKWHPKMSKYIFTDKKGFHIINLEETQKCLEKALSFLQETVSRGGTVLFLGTKKQAKEIVREAAMACGMPFVINRWLGGTLTNSNTILNLVKKYRKLKDDRVTGKLEKYTKKERADFEKEIARLDEIVGGIEKLDRNPDALFVVDIKTEKTAIKETLIKKIPVVALCDTNVNPESVAFPVPANDDATRAIKLMVDVVAAAINEVKTAKEEKKEEAENK